METVEIDPRGDVALQVPCPPPYSLVLVVPAAPSPGQSQGEVHTTINEGARDTRDLVVSSKVLSIASPVFKAMFCGEFSEGARLAARHEPSPPFQLPLPDDDGDAMLLLCKLLHFATDDVPDLPGLDLLAKLAEVCDKYQCTSVLRHCGNCWARNWLCEFETEAPGLEDLCYLFLFTYIADLAAEFAEVAWILLLQHRGPLTGTESQIGILLEHPLLSQGLLERLESKRLQLCNAFHIALMSPITSWNWGSLMQGCLRAATTLARYNQALRDAGLLPYDLSFSGHTFAELLDGVDRLGYIAVPPCPINKRSCGFCQQDSQDNLVNALLSAAHSIRRCKPWFSCLDCCRGATTTTRGKAGGEGERRCRIKHKDDLEIKERFSNTQLQIAPPVPASNAVVPVRK
ncbi:unnamed protein product [Clonostachys chloroleuca]|uniref:BTB domain-containing protein n=1 Tax=Clonostachys chloroleuca TaxID=1926264 RepID=A0AA35M952_9HYPO|nr:unnamed protein product [Clonostachys chloroleuca]